MTVRSPLTGGGPGCAPYGNHNGGAGPEPSKSGVKAARNRETGQFTYEGQWGRLCTCGHELGVHTAEAPHECMNADRLHMYTGDWLLPDIEPTPCDCMCFRPAGRAALTQPPPVKPKKGKPV